MHASSREGCEVEGRSRFKVRNQNLIKVPQPHVNQDIVYPGQSRVQADQPSSAYLFFLFLELYFCV